MSPSASRDSPSGSTTRRNDDRRLASLIGGTSGSRARGILWGRFVVGEDDRSEVLADTDPLAALLQATGLDEVAAARLRHDDVADVEWVAGVDVELHECAGGSGHHATADRVLSMLMPSTFEVSFGPHVADWLMVVVTGLGVLASVGVALVALSASADARKIAAASEAARVEERATRKTEEYEANLDEGVAAFLTGVADHLVPIRAAIAAKQSAPDAGPLVTSIQLFRLRARGEDAEVAASVATLLRESSSRSKSARDQHIALSDLVILVREWRTGAKAAADIHTLASLIGVSRSTE